MKRPRTSFSIAVAPVLIASAARALALFGSCAISFGALLLATAASASSGELGSEAAIAAPAGVAATQLCGFTGFGRGGGRGNRSNGQRGGDGFDPYGKDDPSSPKWGRATRPDNRFGGLGNRPNDRPQNEKERRNRRVDDRR